MADVICNTRSLGTHLTGVQRYITEIQKHVRNDIDIVFPSHFQRGIIGHLWEQFILPSKIGDRLLWSPTNSGPISLRRQVVTVHDLVAIDHPEWVSKRYGGWYRYMLPRLLRNAAHIIAISNFTRSQIISELRIPENRVSVIYNGVDDRFCPQSPEVINKALYACGLPSSKYILSVCSIEPRKNISRLIDAWKEIVDSLPEDVYLVLVGNVGVKRVFPQMKMDNLPKRVFFSGHISDEYLPAILAGAQLFVYPSLYEGFGLPPLEAMACGTPIISSNCSAIPEVVGNAGILIDPNSVSQIAKAVKCLFFENDTRNKLIKLGLAQSKKFRWSLTASETLQLLKKVAMDG